MMYEAFYILQDPPYWPLILVNLVSRQGLWSSKSRRYQDGLDILRKNIDVNIIGRRKAIDWATSPVNRRPGVSFDDMKQI